MTVAATLRAAAAIVESAAARTGRAHWQRIATDLHGIADEMAPDDPPQPREEE